MTFVVDTGVLQDHLRGTAEATTCLQEALRSGRRVAGSVLTRIELRRGATSDQASTIDAIELLLDWVPVDHEIAALAEQHAERYGRTHPDVAPVDYVVAATAERLNGLLLTRSVERFPMFPELTAPY